MSFLGQSRDSFTPSIQHKIEILQSNIGRVYHQHQTLKSLLKHADRFQQLQKLTETSNDIKQRLIVMKKDIQLLRMKAGLNQNSLTLQHGSIQNSIKHVTSQIYRIKQKITAIQAQMQPNLKGIKIKNKPKFYWANNDIEYRIKASKADNKQLLQQIKHKQFHNLDGIFRAYVKRLSKIKSQKHIIQVKRQLGLLYCEVAYFKQSQKRRYNMNNRFVQMKKTRKNVEQQSIRIGQYQCQILHEEHSSFLSENYNRLNYELNMMKIKLEQLKQCVRFRQKSASKNSSSNKKATASKTQQDDQNLRQQLHFLNDRIHSIENQQNGMKKYIKQVNLRRNYNQMKLTALIQSTSNKKNRKKQQQSFDSKEQSNNFQRIIKTPPDYSIKFFKQNQQLESKIYTVNQLIRKLKLAVQ